jgi:hypothetical protein
MIDPELKEYLEKILKALKDIDKSLSLIYSNQ